jgi:hypothetical protein
VSAIETPSSTKKEDEEGDKKVAPYFGLPELSSEAEVKRGELAHSDSAIVRRELPATGSAESLPELPKCNERERGVGGAAVLPSPGMAVASTAVPVAAASAATSGAVRKYQCKHR